MSYCVRHENCQHWRLTLVQCARYHARLSRYHANRAVAFADKADLLARRATMFAWISVAALGVALAGRVISWLT